MISSLPPRSRLDGLRLAATRGAFALLRRTLPRLMGSGQNLAEMTGLIEQLETSLLRGDVTANPRLASAARALYLSTVPPDALELIPPLTPREHPVANTWTHQNHHMQWDIEPNDLVLDVGSGGWPFQRANHLADKFHGNTSHRFEDIARDHRPLFEVDLESLSFADKSYDFVFCSHVLEHLENPGQAIRELTRIGKRGYIEVPTRLSDILFNFTRLNNHHRWHGLVLDGTLLLVEWSDEERRELGNYYFNSLQSPYLNAFQDFFEANRDLFFCSLHWKSEIPFLVIDKHGQIIDSTAKTAVDI